MFDEEINDLRNKIEQQNRDISLKNTEIVGLSIVLQREQVKNKLK
jgi:hypothetical protein